MEENKKGGFSADGRKLRPRRPRVSSERVEYNPSERKNYGEPRNFGDRPQRSYGDRPQRSSGQGGEHRSFGEHRSYGDRPQRSFGDRPQRNYGDKPQRSFGDRPQRSFGQDGEHRSYGEHHAFGDRPQRSFGEKPQRSFGDRPQRNYGDKPQRSFGDRPQRSFGDRKPSFGGKPGFGRQGGFRKPRRDDNEGINRMISRKPQVSDMQFSDNDMAPTPFKEEIRLNKFIANSGVCSRREADLHIQAGVVTVNGEVVTELGTKINVLTDDVRFNGERLKGEEKIYIVMNKPKGYVTTASDPHAEKTVMDLLKNCTARVFPVGRLDKNTTGVLMFTNDGDIAEKLTHPSYDKKKIYQVILDRPVSQEDYMKILEGIELNDGFVKADELEYIDATDHKKMGIEIHSGKNRIVRRIFESLGYEVRALDRVYFAGLTKKGLKKGEWRYLTQGEANILRMGAYM